MSNSTKIAKRESIYQKWDNTGKNLSTDNVQDSINELQRDFNNRSITFDSVADMKAATFLKVGDKVRTLGYHVSGDGGGNDYEIVTAGTGTDDGGSFIDLVGISGQAKGLFGACLTPLQFGAKGDATIYASGRDIANDDTIQIQNWHNYIVDNNIKVLDFGGRIYAINSPITAAGRVLKNLEMKNGVIWVKSTFTGGHVFDYSTVFENFGLDNLCINNMAVYCGSATLPAEATGAFLLPDGAHGVIFSQCDFWRGSGSIIESLDTGPGVEIHIDSCRISGGVDVNPEVVGIKLNGNDSSIKNETIIRGCKINIWCTNGAISISDTHIYDPSDWNIVIDKCSQFIIVGNYIDNGRIRLKNPENTIIKDNKFIVNKNEVSLAWNQGSYGFIEIFANQVGFVISNFSVQDNMFFNGTINVVDDLNVEQVSGNTFSGSVETFLFKDNNYSNNINRHSSHPHAMVSLTDLDSTSKTVDLGAASSDVTLPVLPGPWTLRYINQFALTTSNNAAIKRFSRNGNNVTIHFDTTVNHGTAVISGTINTTSL